MTHANEPARTGGFFVGKLNGRDAEKYKRKTDENICEQAEEAEQEAQP